MTWRRVEDVLYVPVEPSGTYYAVIVRGHRYEQKFFQSAN